MTRSRLLSMAFAWRRMRSLLYLNLGRMYVKLAERGKARGVMLRLLERKPDSAAATNALRELESR